MKNENAFPVVYRTDYEVVVRQGMSLRDWFAGQAVLGLCGLLVQLGGSLSLNASSISKSSYEIADAMLAERDKCQ